MRSIDWLEVTAWMGLTLVLLSLLATSMRHVWEDKVRRIEALEAWRAEHEKGETNFQLVIRDLQNESKNHTLILERMERQIMDVAALVGNRRHEDRSWEGLDPRIPV